MAGLIRIIALMGGMIIASSSLAAAPVAGIKCNPTKFRAGQKCDVYLGNKIEEDITGYVPFLQLLRTSTTNDTIRVHLSGKGGVMSTTRVIISAIRASKAKVITVAMGPVQSAHAYIAISGNHIVIRDLSYFMFHRGSLYGKNEQICGTLKGETDRTLSSYGKCKYTINKLNEFDEKFVRGILKNVLTKEEIEAIVKGKDILFAADEMKKKLKGKLL